MSISSTITPCFGDNADSIGFLHPFLGTQTEIIKTRLTFNYVEFDTIKIGVVHFLPYSQELHSVPVPNPT